MRLQYPTWDVHCAVQCAAGMFQLPAYLTQDVNQLLLCLPALQYESLGMTSHYQVYESMFTDY